MSLLKRVYLLLIFLPLLSNAQESKLKKLFRRIPYDSSYVESYYDHWLHVTLIANSQGLYESFYNAGKNVSATYRPNNVFRFGFGLDYNIFSMEYTHSIDFIDKPNPKKGNTESFNLRLGLTGRRLLASLVIQNYKGMYNSNPEELFKAKIPIKDTIRPDIRTEMVFGGLNYFFNHKKYSSMASLWQIDRQKKSAGSWVVGVTASYVHIGSEKGFVPDSIVSGKGVITDNYNYMAGINIGYAYNFIIRKKWFINMMLIPGLNIQSGFNTDDDRQKTFYGVKPGYHGDARIIAGYNGELWYYGVHSANYLLSNSIKDNIDVNFGYTYFRIFLGRRFYTPFPSIHKI